MAKDDNYTNVLLEDMNAKFDAILEATAPITQLQKGVATIHFDLEEAKSDIKVIKAAVTDMSHQANEFDSRLSRLESQVS